MTTAPSDWIWGSSRTSVNAGPETDGPDGAAAAGNVHSNDSAKAAAASFIPRLFNF